MTIKIGINGFGRIGRMVFRAAVQDLLFLFLLVASLYWLKLSVYRIF